MFLEIVLQALCQQSPFPPLALLTNQLLLWFPSPTHKWLYHTLCCFDSFIRLLLVLFFFFFDSFQISWEAPYNNGSVITGYYLFVSSNVIYSGTGLSYTPVGLSSNTILEITVMATNEYGNSTLSQSASLNTSGMILHYIFDVP
jgi:hypothetical protein